ncbi:MAG: type I-E CRISPR-associated protein Cse2/CasB [Gemmatimonas sp.]
MSTQVATLSAQSDQTTVEDTQVVEWFERYCDIDDGDRATRARLKRTRANHDALAIPATIEFVRRLGAHHNNNSRSNRYLDAVVSLARVLSHVKTHAPGKQLMTQAGWKKYPGEGVTLDPSDYPVLSEVRFKRLLQQDLDGEDRITAFVRLIDLLGGEVDVDSVRRDFLANLADYTANDLKRRWALQYYLPMAAEDNQQQPSPSTLESEL